MSRPESGRRAGPRTLWADAAGRLTRDKVAVTALVWLLIVAALALTADLWVEQRFGDVEFVDSAVVAATSLRPPSAAHPFGTDLFGRDVLGRVVYGARVSLAVGVLATVISLAIGVVLGGLAGYLGRVADAVTMRLADVFLAFPYVLFAVALIAVVGKGYTSMLVAIGVLGWPPIARVFRASVLSVKEEGYVEAARAIGGSGPWVFARHVLPNSIAPVIVYGTMSVGGAILAESALSFLGMGVQPPSPSWGGMLADARLLTADAPWLMFWPGVAIVGTVAAFVVLGDSLRDALDVRRWERA